MKIEDKELRETVDVCDAQCPDRPCYWPRSDPGVFVPGRGYKSRGSQASANYICGTRAIHGCPDQYCDPAG